MSELKINNKYRLNHNFLNLRKKLSIIYNENKTLITLKNN